MTLRGSVYLLRQSLLSTRRLSQSAGSVVLAGTVQLSSPDCRIELHAGGASSIGDSSDSDSDDSSHCSGGVQGQGQAHGQGARQARQGPTGVTLLARGATVTYGNGEFVLYGRVQIEQGVEVTDYASEPAASLPSVLRSDVLLRSAVLLPLTFACASFHLPAVPVCR